MIPSATNRGTSSADRSISEQRVAGPQAGSAIACARRKRERDPVSQLNREPDRMRTGDEFNEPAGWRGSCGGRAGGCANEPLSCSHHAGGRLLGTREGPEYVGHWRARGSSRRGRRRDRLQDRESARELPPGAGSRRALIRSRFQFRSGHRPFRAERSLTTKREGRDPSAAADRPCRSP